MGFGGFLQANTAVDVLIGPFVDDSDGNTAETGLTITQADIRLSKNGQNMAQKNDVNACTHDELGYYNCPLDATDTNTEGLLTLCVHESGALPVRMDFMVLAQAAHISLITAKDSGYMDVNVKAVSEDTTAADNLESACDNYTAQRGLSGTALPDVAADGVGGLPISDAGGLDLDAQIKTAIDSILSMLDDARGEPAQGAPPVNPDAMTKLDYLYKFMRNKIITSATQISVYDDAGSTIDHKSTISDDGTDFTRGEFVSGA